MYFNQYVVLKSFYHSNFMSEKSNRQKVIYYSTNMNREEIYFNKIRQFFVHCSKLKSKCGKYVSISCTKEAKTTGDTFLLAHHGKTNGENQI